MKIVQSLRKHRNRNSALLAANFYNFETLIAVLRAARRAQSEIILQTSPSTIKYLGSPAMAAAMARTAAAQEGVVAWLHLDHATELDLVKRCVDAGYDSVMIDASEQEFHANIRISHEAACYAHAANVAVEAELGNVPKLGQDEVGTDRLTRPEEARAFVAETRVHMLAVAIGTRHGFYTQPPNLDFERLASIRSVIDVPLVLHGGSGLLPEQWRMAIHYGISKINFATEIKNAFIRRLQSQLRAENGIDLRDLFPPAVETVTELIESKLHICKTGNIRNFEKTAAP